MTDTLLAGEWMGVDFIYFSILTSILLLHPKVGDVYYTHHECLENARKALLALKHMQENGLNDEGYFNAYRNSVSWSVLHLMRQYSIAFISR
jgi:hypothetical protein